MADFSFVSDIDESEAVEQILAEAMDHCVLQQVAAINCSSFSNSSLPSHLESRFHRLKTFPSSASYKPQLGHDSVINSVDLVINSVDSVQPISQKQTKNPHKEVDFSSGSSNSSPNFDQKKGKDDNFTTKKGKGENFEGKNGEFIPKRGKDSNFSSKSYSFGSSNSSLSSPNFDPKKGKNKGKDENFTSKKGKNETFEGINGEFVSKKGKDTNFLSRSSSFGSSSSDESTRTVKSGCFWCSPKKKKNSNSSGIRTRVVEMDEWGKHDELLSDVKSFSEKKQKKLMKLARKEEEQVNKEAEKIVKWAKQASSRMEFDGIMGDDDDSDDDYGHWHGFGYR